MWQVFFEYFGFPYQSFHRLIPRRRWVDNRVELGEMGWSNVDWIGLAQDRDKWRALANSIRCWEITE
jgi:hypothetical protein